MIRLLSVIRQAAWLTPRRIRLWAIVPALFFGAYVARDVQAHWVPVLVDQSGERLGRDFILDWAGPRLAFQEGGAAVYSAPDFARFQRGLTSPKANSQFYAYPPVALILSAPFSWPPFAPAYILWLLTSCGLLVWMLTPDLGRLGATIAVLAYPASAINAYSGQNGAFTAALLAGGILSLDRRPRLAGLLFGLLCFKPQLGVLVPVALAAAGLWRTALAALASAVALVGVTILLLGWSPWPAFAHMEPILTRMVGTHPIWWPRMSSVTTAAMMLGAPGRWAAGAQIVSTVAAGAVTVFIWRGTSPTRLKGAALLIATFLATPYAWDYDLVVLLFAAVWYWRCASATGWRPWEKLALASLLISPIVTPFVATARHWPLEPVVEWSVLLVLLSRVMSDASTATSPAGAVAA